MGRVRGWNPLVLAYNQAVLSAGTFQNGGIIVFPAHRELVTGMLPRPAAFISEGTGKSQM